MPIVKTRPSPRPARLPYAKLSKDIQRRYATSIELLFRGHAPMNNDVGRLCLMFVDAKTANTMRASGQAFELRVDDRKALRESWIGNDPRYAPSPERPIAIVTFIP